MSSGAKAFWRAYWAKAGLPLNSPRMSAPVRPYVRRSPPRPRKPRREPRPPPTPPAAPPVEPAGDTVHLLQVDYGGETLVSLGLHPWYHPVEAKLERRVRELEVTDEGKNPEGNTYERLGPAETGKRSVTINVKQMAKEARLARKQLEADGPTFGPELEPLPERPRTRGDCLCGPRPCPWVGCKWNLYLDVDEQLGSIKFNFPDLEVDQVPNNCALDVAEHGGITLEQLGDLINVTRERVRQLEEKAFQHLVQNAKGQLDVPEEKPE